MKQQIIFPIVGVILMFLGTFGAISSIPDFPQEKGALFWPALWMTCGLLAVPFSQAIQGTNSVLRAEYALMLGLVYWLLLDLLQGAYPLYELYPDDIELVFMAIAVMAMGIWIGASGRGWHAPRFVLRSTQYDLSEEALVRGIVIAFLLGMAHYVISSGFDPLIMWKGLISGRWSAPWSRGALGGWDSFLEHTRYFGYVLPSLTVMLARRTGWLRPTVILSIIFSLIMIAFLSQGGGRRVIGVTVGAALVCWVVLQGRLSLKQKTVSLIILTVLLVSMQLMLQYRSIGYGAVFEEIETQSSYDHLHVDDNFLRLGQVVQLFPSPFDYVGFKPVIYVLVRPVPRVLWPGKPVDPGYDLTVLVGKSGLSLSSSIVGELYASYGFLAVFIGGLLLGRFAGMLNRIYVASDGNGRALVFSLGLMVLFAGLRSMQDIVIMSYGLLGWFLIASIIQHRRSVTNKLGNLRTIKRPLVSPWNGSNRNGS